MSLVPSSFQLGQYAGRAIGGYAVRRAMPYARRAGRHVARFAARRIQRAWRGSRKRRMPQRVTARSVKRKLELPLKRCTIEFGAVPLSSQQVHFYQLGSILDQGVEMNDRIGNTARLQGFEERWNVESVNPTLQTKIRFLLLQAKNFCDEGAPIQENLETELFKDSVEPTDWVNNANITMYRRINKTKWTVLSDRTIEFGVANAAISPTNRYWKQFRFRHKFDKQLKFRHTGINTTVDIYPQIYRVFWVVNSNNTPAAATVNIEGIRYEHYTKNS